VQDPIHQTSAEHPVTRNQSRIRFTGSGSEFFRIWSVNLLLTLVTLTLYWPFARARRLTFFHNHTEVQGHALGFHGDPWKMFRGHLVLLVVGGAYAALSYLWPTYDWVGLLLMALVWPLLWRASLGFRMRNTSWRGVRFDFEGSLPQAYKAFLPLFLPGIALNLLPLWIQNEAESLKLLGQWTLAISGLFLLFFPWLLAKVYRFQHNGYRFAQERSALALETPMLYWLFLGIIVLFIVLVAVLTGVGAFLIKSLAWNPKIVVPVLGALGYFLSFIVVYSLAVVKTQNWLWSHTASARVRLHSDLSFWRFLGWSALNWLLTLVTLGLYWPFAAVRMARLRLEAITVEIDGNVGTWVSEVAPGSAGVLADASGDYFGLDMGL
jgi:uncharacterized membrane protein YjgN (DUF898 family)